MSNPKILVNTMLFCSLAVAAVGCTQPTDEAQPGAEAPPGVASELADFTSFDILPAAGSQADGELAATGIWLDVSPTVFPVVLLDSAATLRREGETLVLHELSVRWDDFEHELPGGSRLSHMGVVLEEPIALETRWHDGKVSAQAEVALRLDWSVSTQTSVTPLASQDVRSVRLTVDIEEQDGELHLGAELRGEDVFALPELFEVTRYEVTLDGR